MKANRGPISDEELARQLQYEEQQTGQRIDTGLYTQQELDDLALARHYAQLNMDEESEMRSHAKPSNNYEQTSGHKYNQSSPERSKTVRSESFTTGYGETSPYTGSSSNGFTAKKNMISHGKKNGADVPSIGGRRRSIATSTFQYSQRSRGPEAPIDNNIINGNNMGRSRQKSFHYHPQSPAPVVDPPPECYPNEYVNRDQRHHRNDNKGPSSAYAPSSSAVKVDVVRIRTEEEDLELARRMQDLEDRGMGQQNSDRRINGMCDDDKTNIKGELDRNSQMIPSASTNHNSDLEALAMLLSESGTDVNELSDDVLHELLGAKATGAGKATPSAPPKATLKSSASFRSPDIASPKISPSSAACETDIHRNGITSRMVTTSKSPTYTSGVILKDFDGALSEIPNRTDASSKSKNKRRGLFGFAMADKNRFHLDEITSDAPTTTLLEPASPPPTKTIPVEAKKAAGTSGVPGAIPPPRGGSFSNRQTRSMSPPPRQEGRRPTLHHSISGIQTDIPPLTLTSGIPGAIPPKPEGMMCISSNQSFNGLYRGTNICSACGLSHGQFLKVLDRKYHLECFRCTTCHGRIDPNDKFKYTKDERGKIHPHHRECYLTFGVNCNVCGQNVPQTPDGRVPFIKHPFFSTEVMCIKHADEKIRRCSGCQRLEPYAAPFLDLMDGDRCVCHQCCQSSLVVDSSEANPLWNNVLAFLEHNLKLPIWNPMRNIPVLMVGQQSLQEQILSQGSIHGSTSHLLASGLCLTDQDEHYASSKPNRSVNIVAILCPTGLPRAYVASILAHESIHAWMKFHPSYSTGKQLSVQVEEGLCQLVASLYLSDGILPHDDKNMIDSATETKLRQYYKFCIERDQSDVYGTGYRRAAVAYREIGMEGLLSHVLDYRDFPKTQQHE